MSSIFALVGAGGPDRLPLPTQTGEPASTGASFEAFLQAAQTRMEAHVSPAAGPSSSSAAPEANAISEGDGLGGGVSAEWTMGEEGVLTPWISFVASATPPSGRTPEMEPSAVSGRLPEEVSGPEGGFTNGDALNLEALDSEMDGPSQATPEMEIFNVVLSDGGGMSLTPSLPDDPPAVPGPEVQTPAMTTAMQPAERPDGEGNLPVATGLLERPAVPKTDALLESDVPAQKDAFQVRVRTAESATFEETSQAEMSPGGVAMDEEIRSQTVPLRDAVVEDPALEDHQILAEAGVPSENSGVLVETRDGKAQQNDARNDRLVGAVRGGQRKARPSEVRNDSNSLQTLPLDGNLSADVGESAPSAASGRNPSKNTSSPEDPPANARRQEEVGPTSLVNAASFAGVGGISSPSVQPVPVRDAGAPDSEASPEPAPTGSVARTETLPQWGVPSDLTDPETSTEKSGASSETGLESPSPRKEGATRPGMPSLANERQPEEHLRSQAVGDNRPQRAAPADVPEIAPGPVSTQQERVERAVGLPDVAPGPTRNVRIQGTGNAVEEMRPGLSEETREGVVGIPKDLTPSDEMKAREETPDSVVKAQNGTPGGVTKAQIRTSAGNGLSVQVAVEKPTPPTTAPGTFPPQTPRGEALQASFLSHPERSSEIRQDSDDADDAENVAEISRGETRRNAFASGPMIGDKTPSVRPEGVSPPPTPARVEGVMAQKPRETKNPLSENMPSAVTGEIRAQTEGQVGKNDRPDAPDRKESTGNPTGHVAYFSAPHAPGVNAPAVHHQDAAAKAEALSPASSAHVSAPTPGDAPAPASPALPDAPPVPGAVVNQILRGARFLLQDNVSEVRVHLEPPELGSVHIRIVSEKASLSGEITVSSHEVKGIVESNLHQLRSSLTDQGLQVGHIDVTVRDDRESGHGFNLTGEFRQSGDPQNQRGNPGQNRSPDWTQQEDRRPRRSRNLVDYFA